MASLAAHVSLDAFLKVQYDYVIVGGGTSGLVLAARLTENPNVTVGVVEAGKLRVDDENINGLAGGANMWNNPDYDWVFKTIPQKHNHNRIHHVVRGKFVGGSSGINYMALVSPSSEDIDNWGQHASGWSWSALEPYYRKSQTLQPGRSTEERPNYFRLEPKLHGDSGPIQTSWAPSIVPIERNLIVALNEASNTEPPRDPYSGDHLGMAQHLFTMDRRAGIPSRSYATSGYFVPYAHRPNLRLLTEASVLKILLDNKDSDSSVKATGVMFSHGGRLQQISAKQEIIISSSTIQSPRLLELSGIGNPEILRAAGVECVVDLPEVGENLMEHPMSSLSYELAPGPENITVDSLFLDGNVFQEQLQRLMASHDGLMAGAFGPVGFIPYAAHVSSERLKRTIEGIAAPGKTQREPHERVKRLLASTSAPSIELISLPGYVDLEAGHTSQSKIMPGAPAGHNACYTTMASAMYPLARGNTHIERSESVEEGKEPFATQPRIDMGILSHEADVDAIAAGLAVADRAYKSESVSGRFVGRLAPPPEVDLQDPEQAREYVRRQVMIFNHNSGTCAMGRVVDERLRVKNVSGLRVVDVSVIPDTISANPMATVYALAEKAADMIKEDSPLFT